MEMTFFALNFRSSKLWLEPGAEFLAEEDILIHFAWIVLFEEAL